MKIDECGYIRDSDNLIVGEVAYEYLPLNEAIAYLERRIAKEGAYCNPRALDLKHYRDLRDSMKPRESEQEKAATKGPCLSTHGGAGYAFGTYWDGDSLICGLCGTRIENPPPTGSINHPIPEPTFWGRVLVWFGFREQRYRYEPRWPDWITRKEEGR